MMALRSKTITFHSQHPEFEISKPIPASRMVPGWYRTMPGVKDGTETLKKCIPVLDALTSGYIFTLTADVWYNNESKEIISNSALKINSDHLSVQTENVVLPDEFDPQPHKWINYWHIKTPKGYSTLFIHPLDREDLPFKSFTGIVDTDKHPLVINFPFFMRKDFDGKIPAGTPIIQAIPFKRDSWDSKIIDDPTKPYVFLEEHKHLDAPLAYYKRNSWIKKVFR
jgi:hypothetical protein